MNWTHLSSSYPLFHGRPESSGIARPVTKLNYGKKYYAGKSQQSGSHIEILASNEIPVASGRVSFQKKVIAVPTHEVYLTFIVCFVLIPVSCCHSFVFIKLFLFHS